MEQNLKKNKSNDLYSNVADFGKVYYLINAIIATFISVFLIIVGIYIILHKSHLKSTIGKVKGDSICNKLNKNISSCSINYTYNIDGKNYLGTSTSSKYYKDGSEILVWYDPNHPGVHPEIDVPGKKVGLGLILFAIFILIATWIGYYLVRKYKFAAAASGIRGGLNLII